MGTRRSKEEKRVLHAVQMARMALPGYGRGKPVRQSDVDRLAAFNNMVTDRAVMPMKAPAVLLPPGAGYYHLIVAPHLGPDVVKYIMLHEVGHVMTGDADEPTILRFTGPLPEAEDVVDQFALLGILDEIDTDEGPEWVEQRTRQLVPLDDRGWQVHRIPRLAGKVCRMRELLKEWIDG